jgi:hypothetical protein
MATLQEEGSQTRGRKEQRGQTTKALYTELTPTGKKVRHLEGVSVAGEVLR